MTTGQIASAARLAGLRVESLADGGGAWCAPVGSGETADGDWIGLCKWQPRAATEAGRSDALVLLAAVMEWQAFGAHPHEFDLLVQDITNAMRYGTVQQIQQATFAAAVAIGEYMGEGK